MKYLHQFVTTNLNVGGGIDDSQTTGIVLQSLNNIDATKPSVACLTWADPLDTSVAEWITYTSVNSTTNELRGVIRGAEGYSAKSHLNQAVVAFPLSKSHVNDLNTAVSAEHSTAGVHSVSAMISGGSVLDEDTMASNSATALATQQSIKAYVDTQVATVSNTTGWTASADTWVYASASTFTIAGVDRTTTFTKGTRLKFTQTTVKYAVVVSSSFSTNTTVTIAVNTDHVIANAAITLPYYSYQVNPQGYPLWFAVASPTWTVASFDNGSGGQPTTSKNRMNITGGIVTISLAASGTKAGTNQNFVITTYTNHYPTAANLSDNEIVGHCGGYNSSTSLGIIGTVKMISGGLYFNHSANITDNNTIASWGAIITYEL